MIKEMKNNKSKKLIVLEKILRWMAVIIIRKYHPKVIGITGSVGKTSAKAAVFSVLAPHFRVRSSEKNYNNEIGIPLTIIGVQSGGNSLLAWLAILFKWLGVVIFPVRYPEFLILEIGADRPGDIHYLLSFIRLEVGILTDVSESHIEFFKTIEGVAKEKSTLVKSLDEENLAVLNIDNKYITKIKNQLKSKAITFGFSEGADVRATDDLYNYSSEGGREPEIRGLSFKLNYKGTFIPMRLNYILARHNIYAALAAVCVGIEMGLNLIEIGIALENFCLPQGRMALVPGIKNTSIIDDTYNASPVSTVAALEVLKEISSKRKIAVLGDMLELGDDTKKGHKEVIRRFFELKGNLLFLVGKRMREAVSELREDGIIGNDIFLFSSPMEAGRKLQEVMEEGDLVLIKGSQGIRMEKAVEEVMAEPEKARELLCRQNIAWREKPWKEV